jgi:hypothetical protein
MLNEATAISLYIAWWQREPEPTIDIGIAVPMSKGLVLFEYATNMRFELHTLILSRTHNSETSFTSAGDPEVFQFRSSKFITMEKARQVLHDPCAHTD